MGRTASNSWDKVIKAIGGADAHLLFPRFFESKKNQVTLLEIESEGVIKKYIAKFFVWGDMRNEIKTLEQARLIGSRVPRIMGSVENILFLEFIPGKTLKNISESLAEDFDPGIIGHWLGHFHRSFSNSDGTTLLKGDAMLPNFIVHEDNGDLYGVDFEESRIGNPLEEAAGLAVSLFIGSEPKSAGNIKKSSTFLKSYLDENPISIHKSIFYNFMETCLKNRIKFCPQRQDELENYIGLLWSGELDFF